jgi:hypothetical protein
MICFLAFIAKDYAQPNKKDIITTTIEIVAKGNLDFYSPMSKKNDSANYFARLSVINNEDTTISFCMMNCSWEENWSSDNKDIYLYYPGCDANFPITVKLKPKEFIAFYGVVRSKQKEIINKKFRLGFQLFTYEEVFFGNLDKRNEILRGKKIYWSNEIELKNSVYQFKINGVTEFNDEL